MLSLDDLELPGLSPEKVMAFVQSTTRSFPTPVQHPTAPRPPPSRPWWPLWPESTTVALPTPKSPVQQLRPHHLVPSSVILKTPPHQKLISTPTSASATPSSPAYTNDNRARAAAAAASGANSESREPEGIEPLAPHYAGVFLSYDSTQRLLKHCPPKHAEIHAHHMTMAYKPSIETCLSLPLGQTATLFIEGVVSDDLGQTVQVTPPQWLPYLNEQGGIPHVTISVVPEVEAVYSLQLLKEAKKKGRQGGIQPIAYVKLLHGIVGVYLTDGRIVYSQEELLQALSLASSPSTSLHQSPSAASAMNAHSHSQSSQSHGTTEKNALAMLFPLPSPAVAPPVLEYIGDDDSEEDKEEWVEALELTALFDELHLTEQLLLQMDEEQLTEYSPPLLETAGRIGNRGFNRKMAGVDTRSRVGVKIQGPSKGRKDVSVDLQKVEGTVGGIDLAALIPQYLSPMPPAKDYYSNPSLLPHPPLLEFSQQQKQQQQEQITDLKAAATEASSSSGSRRQSATPPVNKDTLVILQNSFPSLDALVIQSAVQMYGGEIHAAHSFLSTLTPNHIQKSSRGLVAPQCHLDDKINEDIVEIEEEEESWDRDFYHGHDDTSFGTQSSRNNNRVSVAPGKAAWWNTNPITKALPNTTSSTTGNTITPLKYLSISLKSQANQPSPSSTTYFHTPLDTINNNSSRGGSNEDEERKVMLMHKAAAKTYSLAAKAAFNRGDRVAARTHQAYAKEHSTAAMEARKRASALAFYARNASTMHTMSIDMHGMHCEEALEMLNRHLSALESLEHPGGILLRVITGIGNHSQGGKPKLLPAVVKRLSDGGYLFDTEENNAGAIRVLLGGI